MRPRPPGSSRHAVDSCTLRLQAWNPFGSGDPPSHYYKKPCHSDRSTAPSLNLSLADDPRAHRTTIALLARKRRRQSNASRSVSGRSSDRRRCVGSDFHVAATDSSGEMFGIGDVSWASDVSEVRVSRREAREVGLSTSAMDREGPVGVGGPGTSSVAGGSAVAEQPGNELGYGSETGYKGDAEFGYEDEVDVDEEEEDGNMLLWCDRFGGL